MSDVLEALLAAHVKHELARFRGEPLTQLIESQVEQTLRWFKDVTVDDVATRAQIMGIVDRYVVNFKVSGGITELVGEMSRLVLSSKSTLGVNVAQVVPQAAYEEFSGKVVGLEAVRRELVSIVAKSAALGTVTTEVISRTLVDWLFERDARKPGLLSAGLSTFGTRFGTRLRPMLERRVSDLLAQYLMRHREGITRDVERHLLAVLDSEALRAASDEIWDTLSPLPLSEAFALVGEQDIEDFVVLCFEFWLKFRKTPYFRQTVSEGVDYFFSKYGGENLAFLIDDMGVTEEMIRRELVTFLVPLLEHAGQTGFLEQQLRSQLASFYHSPAAKLALAGS